MTCINSPLECNKLCAVKFNYRNKNSVQLTRSLKTKQGYFLKQEPIYKIELF